MVPSIRLYLICLFFFYRASIFILFLSPHFFNLPSFFFFFFFSFEFRITSRKAGENDNSISDFQGYRRPREIRIHDEGLLQIRVNMLSNTPLKKKSIDFASFIPGDQYTRCVSRDENNHSVVKSRVAHEHGFYFKYQQVEKLQELLRASAQKRPQHVKLH